MRGIFVGMLCLIILLLSGCVPEGGGSAGVGTSGEAAAQQYLNDKYDSGFTFERSVDTANLNDRAYLFRSEELDADVFVVERDYRSDSPRYQDDYMYVLHSDGIADIVRDIVLADYETANVFCSADRTGFDLDLDAEAVNVMRHGDLDFEIVVDLPEHALPSGFSVEDLEGLCRKIAGRFSNADVVAVVLSDSSFLAEPHTYAFEITNYVARRDYLYHATASRHGGGEIESSSDMIAQPSGQAD